MSETKAITHPPTPEFAAQAHISSQAQYDAMYRRSIVDPEGFWAEIAEDFYWKEKWQSVRSYSFTSPVHIEWFKGAKTNVSFNCLDRHLEERGDQTAIFWEGNEPGDDAKLSYRELHAEVNKFANVLKGLGVKKGDRVAIYLQMIPEAAVAILACTRIGAVHSIVFGAFSADALRDRIQDSECKLLITQDTALRGAKRDIPMKANADKAVAQCPSIEKVVVVERTGIPVSMAQGRDVSYRELMAAADPV
jgi:acetyl-CoA synthetase